MKPFSHRRRPVHLGPYPLERLPRLDAVDALPPGSDSEPLPPRPTEAESPGPTSAAHAYELYREDVIRRRFEAGLENLRGIYTASVDQWILYDNQGRVPVVVERSGDRDRPH